MYPDTELYCPLYWDDSRSNVYKQFPKKGVIPLAMGYILGPVLPLNFFSSKFVKEFDAKCRSATKEGHRLPKFGIEEMNAQYDSFYKQLKLLSGAQTISNGSSGRNSAGETAAPHASTINDPVGLDSTRGMITVQFGQGAPG